MKVKHLVFLVGASILAACSTSIAGEKDNLYPLASALTKLSSSVESTVRYKNPPKDAKDAELLELSTQHDPGQLTPFVDYRLFAKGDSKRGVVLVCTMDGETALMEDVGCSAEVDAHYWDKTSVTPCDYHLDVQSICK